MAGHVPSAPGHAPQDRQLILLHGWREQILSGLMMLTAIALCVAPWIGGDSPVDAKDAHRNELAVGMIMLFVAIARLSRHTGRWTDWTTLAAGAWLVAAPWVLSLQNTEVFDGSHVLHVAAGTVLIVLAAASMTLRAVLDRKEHPERPSGRHAGGPYEPGHTRKW